MSFQITLLLKDNLEKSQLIERLTVANEELVDTLSRLFGLEGIHGVSQIDNKTSNASFEIRDYVS
jgi:hypothetical protein